jgi:hypothetical protein
VGWKVATLAIEVLVAAVAFAFSRSWMSVLFSCVSAVYWAPRLIGNNLRWVSLFSKNVRFELFSEGCALEALRDLSPEPDLSSKVISGGLQRYATSSTDLRQGPNKFLHYSNHLPSHPRLPCLHGLHRQLKADELDQVIGQRYFCFFC